MKVDIVLGWNRHAIPCCRMKAPVAQNRDDAIVDAMTKPLKKPFLYHSALRINRDFHDDVTLDTARQLRSVDLEILEGYRQGGFNLVTACEPIISGTIL